MAPEPSNSKILRYKMTWQDFGDRVHKLARLIKEEKGKDVKVYGIPKGGVYVAAALASCCGYISLVDTPEEADCFVDDIIDSGATAARYRRDYGKATYALVYPTARPEDRLGWFVFPWERANKETEPTDHVVRLLEYIGENPRREGLVKTPERVIKALAEMTSGYKLHPEGILSTRFESETDEMVILSGIHFTSLCEHHLLPFVGEAAIGYIPDKHIIGISKLVRVVDCFARRLQVQERLTQQVASAIEAHLKPKGVGVVMKAHHSCMSCRGVLQANTEMVTSCMLGDMRNESSARSELLALIRRT